MILMHAMQAPYAIPGIGIQRGDTMYHLLSDISGPTGTAELLEFVRACGGRAAWIQSAGTYREHFDIFGEFAERALALGAQPATNAQVAALLTRKRNAQEDVRPPVAVLSTRQKRAVLQLMERQLGVTAEEVAKRAALQAMALTQRLLGDDVTGKSITLLVGTPRDSLSFTIARELAQAGAAVTLVFVGVVPAWNDEQQTSLTAHAMTIIARPKLSAADLQGADLLIDRLLPWEHVTVPTATVIDAIAIVNAASAPTLAIDAPAGLNPDPDEHQFRLPQLSATATLALGIPLRGLTLTGVASVIGDLWLADIGIPRRMLKQVGVRLDAIFMRASLLRLAAVPLGDGAGTLIRWVVAEE